jgi:hypothetical protein
MFDDRISVAHGPSIAIHNSTTYATNSFVHPTTKITHIEKPYHQNLTVNWLGRTP